MTRKIKSVAILPILLIFTSLVALATQHTSTGEPSRYHHEQQVADRLYQDGDYSNAYKKYRALAKKGDSFSQYRVSYMHLEGLGTMQNTVEAFAWAALSAQDYQDELVNYRNAVAGLVPEKHRGKAERKADYYYRRWGNRAIAADAIQGARYELRECTGSRLGQRCEEVYSMRMPKFWGINPEDVSGSGEIGGGAAPSGSVASAVGNSAGGPTLDVAHYQQLRASIKSLDQYITTHGSTVELGEFVVIEPEAEETNDDIE
jgi:hypothetical protein